MMLPMSCTYSFLQEHCKIASVLSCLFFACFDSNPQVGISCKSHKIALAIYTKALFVNLRKNGHFETLKIRSKGRLNLELLKSMINGPALQQD